MFFMFFFNVFYVFFNVFFMFFLMFFYVVFLNVFFMFFIYYCQVPSVNFNDFQDTYDIFSTPESCRPIVERSLAQTWKWTLALLSQCQKLVGTLKLSS